MSDEEDKKFLPKISLPYTQFFFDREMPIINIDIKGLPRPIPALVDSGATSSMLHPHIAQTLKLKVNYDNVQIGTGAGGGFKYAPSEPVEIELLNQRYMVRFDVVLDDNFAWPCILGHNSIFKFAKVAFKSYKKEFDIFLRRDVN